MTKPTSYIQSRKHGAHARPTTSLSIVAAATTLAALSLPAAHAQTVPATTLPEISVTGTAEKEYKPEQVASPKFTQKLVDTTQTINVIKGEVLKDQGATTLTEALRNVAGVGTFSLGENGRMNTGDAIRMRGFDTSSSIFIDGVRDLGGISRDVFNTEQVEVFKGPAGTDNGRSAASGSINLVSKKAHLDDAFDGSIGVGNAKYKRVSVDWNKPLEGLEGAAFRLNVVGEDSGVAGRDVVKNKKWGIAPTLALGLGTDTRIFFDYLHLEQNNVSDGGIPTIGLPGYGAHGTPVNPYLQNHKVDRNNFYGSADDFDDATIDMFTVRFERDLTPDTKLTNVARWGHKNQEFFATRPGNVTFNATTPLDSTVSRSTNHNDQREAILTNQTNLSTKFNAGGIEQFVTMGVELAQENSKSYTLAVPTLAATNLWNPDPNYTYTKPTRTGAYSAKKLDTISLYAFDTLKFNEQWQVNGGVRADHYDLSYHTNVANSKMSDSDTLFNWKLGALYKPAQNGSIYANYSIQQQPPGTVVTGDGAGGGITVPVAPPVTSTPGNSLNDLSRDPQKTKTVEIGTKWELMDQKLLLSAAWFHSESLNELYCETSASCTQDGKKTVKGLELGVVGQITKDWQVTAGATLQSAKGDLNAPNNVKAADGTNDLPFVPKRAYTLWTTYKVDSAWTVGGGARYIGKIKKNTDGNLTGPYELDSYWVADAMATYQVNKNWNLRFNIDNVFDKDYAASIVRGGGRYMPGNARSYRMTANFEF